MEEELKQFGLTENEVKIYLVLLRLGTANPAEVAEKTGFSRSYVYDALERLLEKGIVSNVLMKNKKYYDAIDPTKLENLASERLENIQKIIPKLLAIKNITQEEIKVELHRGKFVYKTLLNDIIETLKKNGEVLVYGIDDEVLLHLDEYNKFYLRQYFAKVVKLQIKEKVIAKIGNPIPKEAKSSAYRFLPKEVIGNIAFEVYGNKVAIFLWGIPNHLILIQNKEVADSYRNQFKILWENASAK